MNYKTKLKYINTDTSIIKINDDAIGFILSELITSSSKKYFLHITINEKRINELKDQINLFNPNINILTFPAWDCLPYDIISPKNIITTERIKTLCKLSSNQNKKTLVIATINSALQKTIPKIGINNQSDNIKEKQSITIENVIQNFINNGYLRSYTANDVGEFAVRGDIIDIVALSDSNEPIGYRFNFFGNEIESIREFNPISQISFNSIKEVFILLYMKFY